MKRWTLSLLASVTLFAGCSYLEHADTPPDFGAPEQTNLPLPQRNDIQQGMLDNGMKYIVLPNSEPADRVSLQLVVHAGSLVEQNDQKGIAHLVEHMAFNGTERFPSNGIIEHQESLGMVFGRDVNAMTEYHTTSYYLHLPNSSDAMLNEAFMMLSQQASALTFDQHELEMERPVVEEEWRRGLNMMARLGSANRKLVLAGSRFGERDPIGDMELVRHVDATRIQAFYQDWYHPNNMTLIVVGSIDSAKVESLLNTYFAPLPAKSLPPRPELVLPLPQTLSLKTVEDGEITTEVLSVNFRGEQAVPSTEAELAQELLNNLTMSMMDQRLRELYQKESDYVSRMVSSAMPLATGYTNNRVMAILRDGNYTHALEELFSQISRFAAHGFTQQDLDIARRELAQRYKMMADGQKNAKNSRKLMAIFNQLRMQRLLVAPDKMSDIAARLLSAFTLDDVNQHFKQVVAERAPMVIAQINTEHRALLPSQTQVETLWNEAKANPPASLTQNTLPTQLFDKQPQATAIHSYEQFGELHKWTLANGAQVWFHPSDETSNRLQLSWQGKGGFMQLPLSQQRAVSYAARNLSAFGYGGFNAQALSAINAGYAMRVMPYVTSSHHGVWGSADVDSLEQWLQNTYLMLTQPQVDADIWQDKRSFMARNINRRKALPSNQFDRQIDAIWYVNNPALQRIEADELAAIKADSLLPPYRTLFGHAAGHQLVVVGHAEPEHVIELASRYLGHIPSGMAITDVHLPKMAKGMHSVRVTGAQEPQGITRVLFNIEQPFSREMANQASLLARIVSTRMREKLREEAGGVYSVRFALNLDRERDQLLGSIDYSHQPERAQELSQMAQQIMDDVATHGVKQDELDTVREQIHTSLAPEAITDRTRFSWLSEQAADNEFRDMPNDFLTWLDGVTIDAIKPLATRVLTSKNRVDAVLLPAVNKP